MTGVGMTLDVIGVGLGRTGTTSLKSALERIGVAPCYSFPYGRRNDFDVWGRAAAGERIEWDDLFGNSAPRWTGRRARSGVSSLMPTPPPSLCSPCATRTRGGQLRGGAPARSRTRRSSLDSSGFHPAVLAVVRRSLVDELSDREAVIAAFRRTIRTCARHRAVTACS